MNHVCCYCCYNVVVLLLLQTSFHLSYTPQFLLSCRPILRQLVMEALESSSPAMVPLDPFHRVPGGPLLLTMAGHRDHITSVTATVTAISPAGSRRKEAEENEEVLLTVISGSADKTLRSWDWRSSGVLKTFDGHNDEVLCIAMTRDGKFASSGSKDTTVRYIGMISIVMIKYRGVYTPVGTGKLPQDNAFM